MTAIVVLWFCVALVLCFVWFDSKSRWYWKLPLFPFLFFSTLWVSNGYKDFLGWPHYEPNLTNQEYELQWAVVKEQEKEILLWKGTRVGVKMRKGQGKGKQGKDGTGQESDVHYENQEDEMLFYILPSVQPIKK